MCYFRIPDAFVLVIVLTTLAVALSPYLGGLDIGPYIKVPKFPEKPKAILTWLGPLLLLAVLSLFLLPLMLCHECNPRVADLAPGADVDEVLRLKTTDLCDGQRHYVLVTPMESQVRWVTGSVEFDGRSTGSGFARFGHDTVGIGKSFDVELLTTKVPIEEGPLASLPPDSRLSPAIRVQRRK